MSEADLDELAARVDASLAAYATRRTFEEARAALNEAGMVRARRRVDDALARIETAQTELRAAQDVAGVRKTQLEQAIAEVEWELDSRFVVDGNKTYLVETCQLLHDPADGAEPCEACGGTCKTRKPMTADERSKWKQLEARKAAPVKEAAALHAGAESEVNARRDALEHSRLAFSAAKHDLEAAIATVQTLAASIRKEASQ